MDQPAMKQQEAEVEPSRSEVQTRALGVLVALVFLNVLWLLTGVVARSSETSLAWPSHGQAWSALVELLGRNEAEVIRQYAVTLGRVGLTLGVGALAGIAIGRITGSSRSSRLVADPFVTYMRALIPWVGTLWMTETAPTYELFSPPAALVVAWFVADGVARIQNSERHLNGWASRGYTELARTALLLAWLWTVGQEAVDNVNGLGLAGFEARFRSDRIDLFVVIAILLALTFMALDYLIRFAFRSVHTPTEQVVVETETEAGRSDVRTRAIGFLVALLVLNILWLLIDAVREGPAGWPSHRRAWSVFVELFDGNGLLSFSDFGATLTRVVLIFGFGGLLGIAIGTLIGSSRSARMIADPFVTLLRGFSAALVILAYQLWLGVQFEYLYPPAAFLVVWVVADGVARIRSSEQAVGSARWNYTELARTALLLSWIGVLTTEVISVSTGIGEATFIAQEFARADLIVVMAVVGALMHLALDYLIRFAFRLWPSS